MTFFAIVIILFGGEEGIRTLARLAPPSGFRNRPLQPLGYFSKADKYYNTTREKTYWKNIDRNLTFYIVKTRIINYNT